MTTDKPPSSVAAELIASLESEAELVDQGGFTIDQTKARDKLREYQLVAPEYWVLLVVEMAALLGARAVYFDYTEPELTQIRFRCRGFGTTELREPMAGVFASIDEAGIAERARRRAWQKLAIAYNALLGLAPARIELSCPDERGGGSRMRWTGARSGAVEVDALTTTPDERENLLVVEFGARGSDERFERERRWLRSHCATSPLLVMAGAEKVSQGWKAIFETLDGEAHTLRDDWFRSIGVAGLTGTGARPLLRVQTNGVLAEDIGLDSGFTRGFVGLVDLDLSRDLSQSQVLRGEGFDEVLAYVRAGHAELLRKRPNAPAT